MTNSDKLKNQVLYKVKQSYIDSVLEDRGLVSTEEYQISDLTKMQLAKADLYVLLVTAPNVTEGGLSLSVTQKATLEKMASRIYSQNDEFNPLSDSDSISSEKIW